MTDKKADGKAVNDKDLDALLNSKCVSNVWEICSMVFNQLIAHIFFCYAIRISEAPMGLSIG